jgi:hypothetical protein
VEEEIIEDASAGVVQDHDFAVDDGVPTTERCRDVPSEIVEPAESVPIPTHQSTVVVDVDNAAEPIELDFFCGVPSYVVSYIRFRTCNRRNRKVPSGGKDASGVGFEAARPNYSFLSKLKSGSASLRNLLRCAFQFLLDASAELPTLSTASRNLSVVTPNFLHRGRRNAHSC